MRTLRLFAGIGGAVFVAAVLGLSVSDPLASSAQAVREGAESADNARPVSIAMQVDRSRKGDRLRPARPLPVTSSRVVVVTITRAQSMMPDTGNGPGATALAAAERQPQPFPCEGSSIRRKLNPQTPRIRCYA
jgi:hypothetical protein